MKTLHNVLRLVLIDPPTKFDGMVDVEPMVEEKGGPQPGKREDNGDVTLETRYTYVPSLVGPALKREKGGRYFVHVGWYGTKDGMRRMFRRIKVHLDAVPNLIWDCEVTVAGRGADGTPACAAATILSVRNNEDSIG